MTDDDCVRILDKNFDGWLLCAEWYESRQPLPAIIQLEGVDLITPEQTAAIIGQAVPTLASWRSRGQGPPYIKLGREIFYKADSLKLWINSRERTNPKCSATFRKRLELPAMGRQRDAFACQ